MLEAKLYDAKAKAKGKFKLPEVFDGTVNQTVLYEAVKAFMANQRQGTAATKTRSEVSGGGRKPWRQKGTGRARQGTIRAAHWRGGGVVFGPRPRSTQVQLPKRVKRLARLSAFNARAEEGALHVVESLEFEQPRTKQLVDLLDKLKLTGQNVLVLTAGTRREVYLSGRNIPKVEVMPIEEANAYHVLWSDALVVERAAFDSSSLGGESENA